MTDALRLTLTQERPRTGPSSQPVVCLVRFYGELAAAHRKTRDADAPAHGLGVTLDVDRDGTWQRCEIVGKDAWAIVVRPVTA
jgi:hypothetical protein